MVDFKKGMRIRVRTYNEVKHLPVVSSFQTIHDSARRMGNRIGTIKVIEDKSVMVKIEYGGTCVGTMWSLHKDAVELLEENY